MAILCVYCTMLTIAIEYFIEAVELIVLYIFNICMNGCGGECGDKYVRTFVVLCGDYGLWSV